MIAFLKFLKPKNGVWIIFFFSDMKMIVTKMRINILKDIIFSMLHLLMQNISSICVHGLMC